MTTNSTRGNFFEDFHQGQLLRHPTPRTVTDGDVALYIALTGDRRPLHCSVSYAQALGFAHSPIHDWLAFHLVFGKSVGEVSLNAVANLGYADGRFLRPIYRGDTLRAESEVLGVKEVSSGKAGIVWVRTRGLNQRGEEVLTYVRWVMVEKREPGRRIGVADEPKLREAVPAAELRVPEELDLRRLPEVMWATGGHAFWEDYQVGDRIDHPEGMTIEESDHLLATRLYQNPARVHFDGHRMAASRFGRRLMYGGHVISVASALAFAGMENAICILALNGGLHANPTFGGDTIYARTEVKDRARIPGRDDVAALRVLLSAVKNADPVTEPKLDPKDPRHVLGLDLWLALPTRR